MSDFFPSERPETANLHEFTVSELAGAIKRTIETNFDRVRVRGELGRVTIARSGHMYADIKDDKSVINTIMWKGSVSRLPFRPEEGLEVVAEGKLSTYPGRSNYQLIADTMQPAGAGALMALLEERRKKLAAEGLFDASRKQPLPTLPKVIGVVTSLTGAVIRDILHRIQDRFPVRVLVWPALVQGEKAAEQIAAGIRGFNALTTDGKVPRPDVLIVARGGGSVEDLWPFNEEIVVRAAADSQIPLISAVGHETDTTLIDFASDQRAPTPTGAAEIAVPVRSELVQDIGILSQRLTRALSQTSRRAERDITMLAARLPKPETLLEARQQRFDYAEGRLSGALKSAILRKQSDFSHIAGRLQPGALRKALNQQLANVNRAARSLGGGLQRLVDLRTTSLEAVTRRYSARGERLVCIASDTGEPDRLGERMARSFEQSLKRREDRLNRSASLLEALSYQATLNRGFAVVKTRDGALLRTRDATQAAEDFTIQFADGDLDASAAGRAPASKPGPKPAPPKKGEQGSLF